MNGAACPYACQACVDEPPNDPGRVYTRRRTAEPRAMASPTSPQAVRIRATAITAVAAAPSGVAEEKLLRVPSEQQSRRMRVLDLSRRAERARLIAYIQLQHRCKDVYSGLRPTTTAAAPNGNILDASTASHPNISSSATTSSAFGALYGPPEILVRLSLPVQRRPDQRQHHSQPRSKQPSERAARRERVHDRDRPARFHGQAPYFPARFRKSGKFLSV